MPNYELEKPSNYIAGVNTGVAASLQRADELQELAEGQRNLRIVNLITEQQQMPYHQGTGQASVIEPMGKVAYDMGIEQGVRDTLMGLGFLATV
jgi:hypothetical protein